jgi:hypothetical protein
MLHDCNPSTEEEQLVPRQQAVWTGDVWKSIAKLRMTRKDLSIFVIDTDMGCGIVRAGIQELFPLSSNLSYEFLQQHRKELLNFVTVREWLGVRVMGRHMV